MKRGRSSVVIWHGALGTEVGFCLVRKARELARYGGTNGNSVVVVWRRCKADQADEPVECSAQSLVEAVEPGAFLSGKGGIAGNGIEETGGKGGAQSVEELQE